MKKKVFTLVEIALALMVAAVGIIGIIALFPVGLAKNKETIAVRSAADAGDQFLHVMTAKLREDWEYKNAFPDDLNSFDESTAIWSDQNILENSNIDLQFVAQNTTDSFNYLDHVTGVFRVKQITPGNYVDFDGVIRSWKQLIVTEDPRLKGDIMPWGVLDASSGGDDIGFGFVNGEDYIIKNSAQGQVTPGNFGCVNFGGGGGGAAAYLGFIENGGISASIGDTFPPLPGDMVGPTITGVNSRLENTPYILIPIVDSFPSGANGVVTIVKFLPFKLKSVSGGGNVGANIKATYIGSDKTGVEVSQAIAEKIVLIAEVSYPASRPYSDRAKDVFSVALFSGNLRTIIRDTEDE
jgi:hypothetical protein